MHIYIQMRFAQQWKRESALYAKQQAAATAGLEREMLAQIAKVSNYSVLYCVVLYCIVVLYCVVLYYIVVLYCLVLYCVVLYCVVLYRSIVLYGIGVWPACMAACIVSYCTVLTHYNNICTARGGTPDEAANAQTGRSTRAVGDAP